MKIQAPLKDYKTEFNDSGKITEILFEYALPMQTEVWDKGAVRDAKIFGLKVETVEQIDELLARAARPGDRLILMAAREELQMLGVPSDPGDRPFLNAGDPLPIL